MDISKCWIKQMKNYAFTLAKINPHILFLEACLKLGLTPKGLTSKPPISGSPQYMWPKLIQLHQQLSFETTQSVLIAYKVRQSDLSIRLNAVTQLLLNQYPNLIETITDTVRKANLLQDQLAKTKLNKLSQLCQNQIQNVGYVSTAAQPLNRPNQNVSLLGDKPSLATILNLPTPINQLPKLPQIPKKPQVKSTSATSPKNNDTSVLNLSNHVLTDAEISLL
jgi:hypothetical protein